MTFIYIGTQLMYLLLTFCNLFHRRLFPNLNHDLFINRIARGYPKPYVKWFKKIANTYDTLPFVNDEVLTVKKALFQHTGQYKCEAINAMGTDTATFGNHYFLLFTIIILSISLYVSMNIKTGSLY